MPTATTNLHYWFYTLFTEMYEVYDHEDEKDTRDMMVKIIGITTGSDAKLKEWCEEQLVSTDEVKNESLRHAMLNTVDWMKLRLELLGWFNENYELEEEEIEEEITENTCGSCGETKIDTFYDFLLPEKNTLICTDCRTREETCRCCKIKYIYYAILWDSPGKFICRTCDKECPCDDPKCGAMCPGKKTDTVHVYPPLSSQNTVQNTDF